MGVYVQKQEDLYYVPPEFVPEWNMDMYGPFTPVITDPYKIHTFFATSITDERMQTYMLDSLLNICKDGLYDERVRAAKFNIVFADNESVIVSFTEFVLNVMAWLVPARTGEPITSKWFFYAEEFQVGLIIDYLNDWLTSPEATKIPNIVRNQTCADTLQQIVRLNEFALLFNNTFDMEQFVALRDEYPEVADWMDQSERVPQIPIDQLQGYLNGITGQLLGLIKTTEVGIANAIRTKEIFNPKQTRELLVAVGATVNGVSGDVFKYTTETSFIDKGLNTARKYYIESSKGRAAQMVNFDNVGKSGAFARLLSLNNMETFLNEDPNYKCDTQNLIKFTITNAKTLDGLRNRYFKFSPNSAFLYKFELDPVKAEMNPDNPDKMIGKTIYLYSPITCNSHSFGTGICRRCYGDLYFTNININVGQIAGELLSSQLTQRMLSAKHLLEANIQPIKFNDAFHQFMTVDGSNIRLKNNPIAQDLIIPVANLIQEDDESETDTTYSITNFFIATTTGERVECAMTSESGMYVSYALMRMLQTDTIEVDEELTEFIIPVDEIFGVDLFVVNLVNNGLNSALVHIKSMINKESLIDGKTKEQFLAEFVESVQKGGINIDQIHLEVILSNQIRQKVNDRFDVLNMPRWHKPNEQYTLITLNRALKENPSICLSLEYQTIASQLISPISLMKTRRAKIDVIFMQKPQLQNDRSRRFIDNSGMMVVTKGENKFMFNTADFEFTSFIPDTGIFEFD